jgi:hypothetical protein
MPRFTNFNNYPRDLNGIVSLNIGTAQGLTFSLLASDPNPGDLLNMYAYGEAMLFAQDAATFEATYTGNGNEVEGVFSWYPNITMAREKPYITVFRIWDEQFAFDEAVLLHVRNNTGIEEPLDLGIGQVYPNPATSSMFIPLTVDKTTELKFTVYNYAGMQVKSLGSGQYTAGQHLVRADINELAAGAYFLAVEQDGHLVQGQKFVVAR